MYNMNDYRAALDERDDCEMESSEWNLMQHKVMGIATALVAGGNIQMVNEIVDEVYSLNECGASLNSEEVQFDLWVLESNGYEEQIEELKNLNWE